MIQYLELLKTIKEKGTYKPAAREGMPGTLSLFGYQMRFDLQEGFPLLTTKKMFWKGIVTELLWFLRGDTNIKFLVDNNCNIWNEDAYNYYCKIASNNNDATWNKIYIPCNNLLNLRSLNLEIVDSYSMFTFEEFVEVIKNHSLQELKEQFSAHDYTLGDCGYQYGKVWRDWEGDISITGNDFILRATNDNMDFYGTRSVETIFNTEIKNRKRIDQIANVIKSLKETPESRRHIVTAIDPAHDQDLALYWCHAMFQFNCRPLTDIEREIIYVRDTGDYTLIKGNPDTYKVPKYYLDCQLYQRSADVVLGVPFNIASYALLTHIIAKICNMIPGEFIHTFGDVHIYDNHMDAVNEQLGREPRELPTLKFSELIRWNGIDEDGNKFDPLDIFTQGHVGNWEFDIENYNPHPPIKAKLSTGLK